jgi:hypothetical protein
MPDNDIGQIQNKPTGEVVEDVLAQSHEALERAAKATAELEELKRRGEDALDWRKQLHRHSWLALGLAAGVSVLLFLVFKPRR